MVTGDVIGIVATHDADFPRVHGCTGLLYSDLWEHAYYLDYNNRRADLVTAFLDHLVNWDFANANLTAVAAELNEEVPFELEPNTSAFVMPEVQNLGENR